MDTEEIDVQVEQEIAEQEETTEEETESQPEDTVVISKEKFKAMQEKAIKFDDLKKNPPKTQTTQKVPNQDISSTDLYALMEAKVPQEDIDIVQKYAKLEGISLAEALKSSIVKTVLADKSEKRKTAETTHTGTAKRGASKLSDDALLQAAKKGNLSNLSDDDYMRLASLKG